MTTHTPASAQQALLTDDEMIACFKDAIQRARAQGLADAGPHEYVAAGAVALLSKLRAPVADERAAFETAYTGMLNDRSTPPTFAAFMRNPDGSYALPIVERAWAMWQARAALASAPTDPDAADVDFRVRVLENLDTWRAEDWSELLERRPAILAMLRPMVLASAPVADERQAFETRFNVPPDNWTRSGGGGYRDIWHETRWEGWRARAALASAPVADERAARDWPEDFSHENGNYQCLCHRCKQVFHGHKRRVTCKVCHAALASAPVAGEAEFRLRWDWYSDSEGSWSVIGSPSYGGLQDGDEIALYAAPQASEAVRDAGIAASEDVAPWTDFAGNPIKHGDRIRHPKGLEGVVVRLPGYADAHDAWCVAYQDRTVSRLSLQIGDRGQAVVQGALSAQPGAKIDSADSDRKK